MTEERTVSVERETLEGVVEFYPIALGLIQELLRDAERIYEPGYEDPPHIAAAKNLGDHEETIRLVRAALTPNKDTGEEEFDCATCEDEGSVCKNFGIHSPGRPEIVPCPDCQPKDIPSGITPSGIDPNSTLDKQPEPLVKDSAQSLNSEGKDGEWPEVVYGHRENPTWTPSFTEVEASVPEDHHDRETYVPAGREKQLEDALRGIEEAVAALPGIAATTEQERALDDALDKSRALLQEGRDR